ncbi:MAG: hypothetical protein ABSB91_08450 [Sedimentisphaerales bacterium]
MLVRRHKMKNTVTAMIAILLIAGVAYFAFATEQTSAMAGKQKESCAMPCKGMMHKGMMHKEMMGMCPMHSMMCEHMMKKEIIATEDGGVIIMCCNKLYKYDKDLNLVKEVELKIDQDMKAMMGNMQKECMEKCQMMKMEKPAAEKP